MNYPVWFIPSVGGGFLIALIAIVHVFISHFAVGGGLYLVLTEYKALNENNRKMLDFVKGHAKFFLLITMVMGSITGVGIWFIIALVNPEAVSLLIHTFVFGWATEWVFFVVEIVAAFVYFYTFGKMDNKTHLTIGWIYFIAAWMSLFLINGIIDFMLTPGSWVESRNFWEGFFNPTFFPSLFFRTFIATMMAGVYAFLTSAWLKDQTLKKTMTRYSGKWSLISLICTIPSGLWYLYSLPQPAQELVTGKSPTIKAAIQWGIAGAAVVLLFSLAVAFLNPKLNKKSTAWIVFLAAFVYFGGFEWTREAARRPYVINQVLYSNSIYQDNVPSINEEGFLTSAKWVTTHEVTEDNKLEAGKFLYIHQCNACHTLGGFNNDIISRTASMSYRALVKYIERIHEVRYFMPPFAGTNVEVQALASYITGDIHGKAVPALELETGMVAGVSAAGDPALIFEDNCSGCHETEDFTDLIVDWDLTKIRQSLDMLDQLNEDMPPFKGSQAQKDSLAGYLLSIKGGDK